MLDIEATLHFAENDLKPESASRESYKVSPTPKIFN
jgi:hypothetical protein